MTIQQDEYLKATCHGLLLGCLLPILAYNIGRGKTRNLVIYGGLLIYELGQIGRHLVDAQGVSQT